MTSRVLLPATILGSSLAFIDGSVVNVALPAIQRDLGAPLPTLQWVVNAYMLTLASVILLGGAAGDRYGRRLVFLVGLAGFAAASMACGLAPGAGTLVAARAVQGVAAGLLAPASLALIGAGYSGDARGRAIGTWAAAGAVTTALGPPLGGWLLDTVGWRAIFFINPPIAAVAFGLGLRIPADRGAGDDTPLDTRGAVLAVATLGLVSYGLIALGEGDTVRGAAALLAAAPAGAWFVRTEARAPAPMLPLVLFRNRTFAGANALTLLLYAALSAALFVLPFLLIQVRGLDALMAGLALLPLSVLMGAGSRWSGGLAERYGPRPLLIGGPGLAATGFAVLGLSAADPSYLTGILPGLLVMSTGLTLSVAPLTTTVFASAPEARAGAASGINNAAARAAGLLAVAAVGLAFGTRADELVVRGYRVVMLASALLAAGAAALAAWTLPRR